MRIQPAHPDFIMPIKGSKGAGAWDIFMPEAGMADGKTKMVDLGFKAAVPYGFIAILVPRSSTGAKHGLELNNTCGFIDSDYRGNWMAALKTKSGLPFSWAKGDRVLQFTLASVYMGDVRQVEHLDLTERAAGGFGSTGS
jgi:dUTP pyrophosphatase